MPSFGSTCIMTCLPAHSCCFMCPSSSGSGRAHSGAHPVSDKRSRFCSRPLYNPTALRLKHLHLADEPAARRGLALHLLELLGAPLGAWRCSNAAARDTDAAETLGPQLAAALSAVSGDLVSPFPGPDPTLNPDSHAGGSARASGGCAAWLSPECFYACSHQGAPAADAGSGAAAASEAAPAAAAPSAAGSRSQPPHPAHAWFQVCLRSGRVKGSVTLCRRAMCTVASFCCHKQTSLNVWFLCLTLSPDTNSLEP